MSKTVPIYDLQDPRFREDTYRAIEDIRSQSPFFRTPGGAFVFLNQPEANEILACQNFRFHFNQINENASPYLAKSIQHELLNMHGKAHERLSNLLRSALRDRVFEGLSHQYRVAGRLQYNARLRPQAWAEACF